MNSQKDEIEIDLREIFLIIRRNLLVIVAVTVLGGLAAGLFSYYMITPKYTSTAKIYILTNSDSVISLSDLQMGSSLANDYSELINSRPVAEEVANNLNLDISYQALLSCISINNPTATRIIWIQATYPDPTMAMKIANEFSAVARKQISRIMNVDEPRVAEEAIVAKYKSSPNNTRNAIIGAALGLVLVMAVLIMRYLLDDTIKGSEDVERYLDLHMLAAIPEEGGTDNTEKKKKKKKIHGIRKDSSHV